MTGRADDMQVDAVAGSGRRGSLTPAYEVLDRALDGYQRLAPPTIDRALAALMERGGVHRLESLDPLVACGCERPGHDPVLSIREEYGVLEEAVSPQFGDELPRIARRRGFASARQGFEGHCPCARSGSDEAPT